MECELGVSTIGDRARFGIQPYGIVSKVVPGDALPPQFEDRQLKHPAFDNIVSNSPEMFEVFEQMLRIGPYFRTVLITGPTGSGKDLLARALHQLAGSNAGPFVVCNCPAVVESLFESELFGHIKGAFTGAVRDRKGLIESADGGTILLDELCDLPLRLQSKLLRTVENQEIKPVGSTVTKKVNVRIIAATNGNLRERVSLGEFREDLYYRLGLLEINVPPLSNRRGDIPILIHHFMRRFADTYGRPIPKPSNRLYDRLLNHSWPGNVRELENVVRQMCMMADGGLADVQHLPRYLTSNANRAVLQSEIEDTSMISIGELQRRHVLHVLERVGRSKARAAEVLGISRSTLYRLLQDSVTTSASCFVAK
jgi:transcriptional regulator with PAS, ATPase and Fis domain